MLEIKEIEKTVCNYIKEQLGDINIDVEADLQKEYPIDSIALMDFVMSVEENYNIEFSDEDLENMKTVRDISERVQELVG